MRASEFIIEKVNPTALTVGFKQEKTLPNGFVIRAETKDLGGDPVIFIRVFDPKNTGWMASEYGIADAKFIASKSANGDVTVHSISTGVSREYRRQGLATEMYKFVRELGNDISPAKLQTDDGRAMWQGFDRAGALAETLSVSGPSAKAQDWIAKVYQRFPDTWQNNHVMVWGSGEDQQFAMFELVPSVSKQDAVEVKWFQAYPLRQGVGSRAMRVLQDMAQADGIALTLYPWDKGQVSQTKLMKFYRSMGFTPTVKGSKNLAWTPAAELTERVAAQEPLRRGSYTIYVDQHAIERAVERAVSPDTVDQVINLITGAKDKIKHLSAGEAFYLYSNQHDVSLGIRVVDPEQRIVKLKTIIGSKPWGGRYPIYNVK